MIAGAARGRRLTAPRGPQVRPTADRVKEALFASLQPWVPGARVLDLYAGAGGLGLEARSRGAAAVTFVERDRAALAALRRNLEVVGLDGTHLVVGDVIRVLAAPLATAPFDLVLADPPYDLDPSAALALLADQLAPGAVVVVERSVRSAPLRWPAGLTVDDPRRYGDTVLLRAHAPGPEDQEVDR